LISVPVGSTVTWRLAPFDYDQHSVDGVGAPLLAGGGEFPYRDPSEVRATFLAPDVYRYRDRYYGQEGVVVVR
jgi:hypothetical protein